MFVAGPKGYASGTLDDVRPRCLVTPIVAVRSVWVVNKSFGLGLFATALLVYPDTTATSGLPFVGLEGAPVGGDGDGDGGDGGDGDATPCAAVACPSARQLSKRARSDSVRC